MTTYFNSGDQQSAPDSGAGTSVLERPEVKEETQRSDNGDADRYAHYVSKDRIAESRMTGRPVVALCGKIWVPKRDPSQYRYARTASASTRRCSADVPADRPRPVPSVRYAAGAGLCLMPQAIAVSAWRSRRCGQAPRC